MVPIWNEQKQIIGYQIRNDANGDDAPKYFWATSKPNLRRSKGASSHLQNGELPLTFCVPLGDESNKPLEGVSPSQNLAYSVEINPSKKLTGHINLSEGILKTSIMAQLRVMLVIGAAGGNFAGSPEILKRYLESASALLGTKQVVLWPDAGAQANRQVMLQYRRTYYLLKKWGYTLQIAWWGQIDKKCLDGDEYLDEYELLTWQQFEGMSRHPNRFWDSVKQELGKIKRCLQRKPPAITPAFSPELPKKENKLEYVPGFLPSYGEYVEMGCPKITYKNDERVTIWKEAILKGWSHILDKSAPGLGKSYTVGNLTAEYMGIRQLMYLASDHRNPTTMTIERNFVDVPPRHGGLVNDPTRLTPTGRPFHVHPTNKNSNDEHAVPSNCVRHNVFRATTAKNLNLESSDSDICQGCNLLHACRGGIMEVGGGYLSQRMLALQYSQLRLHPDSTPLPHTYDYSNVGLIWDEASPLFNIKKKIEVRISDFLQTVGQQIVSHLGFGDYPADLPLTIVYKVLRGLFDTKQESLPRYGLNDSEIAKLLGQAPDIIAETIRELVELEMYALVDMPGLKELAVDGG
jgi:hypothetical protein